MKNHEPFKQTKEYRAIKDIANTYKDLLNGEDIMPYFRFVTGELIKAPSVDTETSTLKDGIKITFAIHFLKARILSLPAPVQKELYDRLSGSLVCVASFPDE